jgi:hypothetical protein
MTGAGMTKGERDDLARLIRQRERVMKTAAVQRSAELLADFERQMGSIYAFDQDETWKAAHAAAKESVDAATREIERRCQELGIPKEFAPGLNLLWYGRGENALKSRREELRRMAKTRIEAMAAAARTAIETHSVDAQTQLLAGSLTSDAAREFLAQMPKVQDLMPALDATTIKGLLGNGTAGDDLEDDDPDEDDEP